MCVYLYTVSDVWCKCSSLSCIVRNIAAVKRDPLPSDHNRWIRVRCGPCRESCVCPAAVRSTH